MTAPNRPASSGTLVWADASKVSPAEFLRMVLGKPPLTEAEKAEAQARGARVRLFETIQRVEYAKARREREAIIRDSIINGTGDYDEYLQRVNAPFERAAKRVKARLAEYDARRAA